MKDRSTSNKRTLRHTGRTGRAWHFFFILLILTGAAPDAGAQTPAFPFPHHTAYAGAHIQPTTYTQGELDTQTAALYTQWKAAYLKHDCGPADQYYVLTGDGARTVSEAHGYGMMITALMAGYDPDAKQLFDGLFRYYKAHPSLLHPALMDWQQVTCDDPPGDDDDSASDGDIDIAFALLLAHAQWGSGGTIHYLAEADTLVSAVRQAEVNPLTDIVQLGDWCAPDEPAYYFGARPSDFIADHFKCFACLDSSWNAVTSACYNLIEDIQDEYSPATGLVPDFIVGTNTSPAPAGPYYLEDSTDGYFSYNACRVPWRLGTDWLLYGDMRARTAILKLNDWLRAATGGNPDLISNGYRLDGSALYDWNDPTFTAPLAVAAMADTAHPDWIDALYDHVRAADFAEGDYYSNTLKLLSLLVISGNYWAPDCALLTTTADAPGNLPPDIFPVPARTRLYLSPAPATPVLYRIVSPTGRLICTGMWPPGGSIPVASLRPGGYVLQIISRSGVRTMKFLRE